MDGDHPPIRCQDGLNDRAGTDCAPKNEWRNDPDGGDTPGRARGGCFRASGRACDPCGRRPAFAQAGAAYPNRTVRLIVPFTPAGTTDIAARILAERLTQRLGQQVVVENRAGAGGNVGSEVVAKADPDGYTLLMCTISSGAINYSLYGARMPYKPEDLAAAGLMLKVPNAIFVANGLPVRTLRELVDYAKARPGAAQPRLAPAPAPACT